MDIHLIPGLGADGRIFQRFMAHAPQRVAHDHPRMPSGSSLRRYAEVIAERIPAGRPHVVVGMSMGGMIAQELATLTRPVRTVIISSWKGPQEMPLPLRTLRGTHPERTINPVLLRRLGPMIRWTMGVSTPEEVALLSAFMRDCTLEQMKVQVNAVMEWEGPAKPVPGLVHIHGDADRLMPVGLIKDAVVVKGGGHFMVYTHAPAVEQALRKHVPELGLDP